MGSKQRPRAARAEAARVGDGGRGSILINGVTLFEQQYDRGTCYELLLAINTWYMVPVPGIIHGARGLRMIRKKQKACFYMEPRLRFYTRTRKFKNEVTNRWGKKGPSLNLKKSWIINGFSVRSGSR